MLRFCALPIVSYLSFPKLSPGFYPFLPAASDGHHIFSISAKTNKVRHWDMWFIILHQHVIFYSFRWKYACSESWAGIYIYPALCNFCNMTWKCTIFAIRPNKTYFSHIIETISAIKNTLSVIKLPGTFNFTFLQWITMILYGLEKTMKTEIRIDQKLKDYPTLSLTVFPLLFIIQSTALALKDKLVYKLQ